jgi:hypothetical protein
VAKKIVRKFSSKLTIFREVSNFAKRYKALSFECLDRHPSRSINIVDKDDYIQRLRDILKWQGL